MGERLKNPLNPEVLPDGIWEEYEAGIKFKSGLGKRGLYEQGRINERFFIGDQWHGARCGNDRPLVRHNLIKRIGEYKRRALFRCAGIFPARCWTSRTCISARML